MVREFLQNFKVFTMCRNRLLHPCSKAPKALTVFLAQESLRQRLCFLMQCLVSRQQNLRQLQTDCNVADKNMAADLDNPTMPPMNNSTQYIVLTGDSCTAMKHEHSPASFLRFDIRTPHTSRCLVLDRRPVIPSVLFARIQWSCTCSFLTSHPCYPSAGYAQLPKMSQHHHQRHHKTLPVNRSSSL